MFSDVHRYFRMFSRRFHDISMIFTGCFHDILRILLVRGSCRSGGYFGSDGSCGPGGPVWSRGSVGACPKIDKYQV